MKNLFLLSGIVLLIAAVGVFVWTTDAPAYLGHDPATCNNCHVMDAAYENWYHAAHSRFATCSDCHLPHQTIVSYYLYKGYSGVRDVVSFTTKTYPVAIRATAQTDAIIQANCIRCHTSTVESILAGPQPFDRHCWDCHRTVAHGDRGLSLTLYQDTEVYPR
ncbi:MAG: cytochrome c nitrite reductase small subunit [Anaerolineales bacterium]|jgi:cytochrome c nitrite reductase small subunit